MKKILLLGTGGTIACVPSEDGLVPALDGPTLISMVPQLDGMCDITYMQILNLDSSNLSPSHWQTIAQAVADHYDDYDGIVITHGTDTMAYTAAALSQMLRNCRKPVVLTGAQLPMQAAGSDAPGNVLHAFMAATSDIQGVFIAFDDILIHGAYAKKTHSEAFHGFDSINHRPAATFAANMMQIVDPLGGATGEGTFYATTQLEPKVAAIKITPGLSPKVLDIYTQLGYKGLILESFGAGGVPNDDSNNWLPALERTLRAGVQIVCNTQCLHDGTHLDVYPIGILAERLGAQSAGDDTIETSLAKLMVSLAK